METPKSMQPPAVTANRSGIQGFDDFERWASRNVVIWSSARHYCAGTCEHRHDYLKIVAYMLVLENQRLKALLVNHAEEAATPNFRT